MTRKVMPTGEEVVRCAEKFKRWLKDRGAEVMAPTNEYEVVRFKTGRGTAIIYRKKEAGSRATFVGDAEQAWFEYSKPTGSTWRAIPPTRRRSHDNTLYQTLRQRDGEMCFFCAEHMQAGSESVEHLISITDGGPDHISNKFLAHPICNSKAGSLSAVQKIQMYHFSRMKQYQRTVYHERQRNHSESAGHPGETGDSTWGCPVPA